MDEGEGDRLKVGMLRRAKQDTEEERGNQGEEASKQASKQGGRRGGRGHVDPSKDGGLI